MNQLSIIVAGIVLALSSQSFAAEKVDFDTQIRPIVAESCYKCHDGRKRKGGLRLDNVESIRKGGKAAGANVVVPGNPDKSDLYRRIALPQVDDDAMPPDGKGQHLKKSQIDLIRRWIAEGAGFGNWKAEPAKE